LGAAIQKIFAATIADALSGMTPKERDTALGSFASATSTGPLIRPEASSGKTSIAPDNSEVFKVGGDVTRPRVLYAPDTKPARDAQGRPVGGLVVLGLIVDKTGRPCHIRIVRSVGPELDKNALESVSAFRFAPATLNGQPVSAQADVEVNFRPY
jgi:TonB family protein